jgi:hypothetical protein
MTDHYHFYILDEGGRTAGHREHICRDAGAALELAHALGEGRAVDVYAGERCVARLKKKKAQAAA